MEVTKKCSRCPEGQNIKPVSEFYKKSQNKDGLYSWCKECFKKADNTPTRRAKKKGYKAQYHIDHAETINAKTVQWQKDNPEKVNAKNKRYYARHREERLAYHAAYRNINRLLVRARCQRSRRKKSSYYALRRKLYREDHRAQFAEYAQQRRARLLSIPIIETVELEILFRRDKGICGICHQRICRLKDASRDHIIPVTVEGSEHSYRNMVIAHKWCNSFKGNRTVPQQMRLF